MQKGAGPWQVLRVRDAARKVIKCIWTQSCKLKLGREKDQCSGDNHWGVVQMPARCGRGVAGNKDGDTRARGYPQYPFIQPSLHECWPIACDKFQGICLVLLIKQEAFLLNIMSPLMHNFSPCGYTWPGSIKWKILEMIRQVLSCTLSEWHDRISPSGVTPSPNRVHYLTDLVSCCGLMVLCSSTFYFTW